MPAGESEPESAVCAEADRWHCQRLKLLFSAKILATECEVI
jgi:hypothetical protein